MVQQRGGRGGTGRGSHGHTEAKHKGGEESPHEGERGGRLLRDAEATAQDSHVHLLSWLMVGSGVSLTRNGPQRELPRAQLSGLHVSHLPGLKPVNSVWRNTSVIRAKSKDEDGEGGVVGPWCRRPTLVAPPW